MKHVEKRAEEPERLKTYRQRFPDGTWEAFRHSRANYQAVKRAILEDQHGLCAYCEIAIQEALRPGQVDDFRVEHFYPKSASKPGAHNFHLDWRNMLGVCHGGSQPNVGDADWRFSPEQRDRSCDVLKGNKEIEGRILNPLLLPARARIFRYNFYDGAMAVDEKTCPPELIRPAQNTIAELNLNCSRLKRMRLEVIRTLFDDEVHYIDQGMDPEEVHRLLAEEWLQPDEEGNCLPFFSVMRFYLGAAAEEVLARRDYKL